MPKMSMQASVTTETKESVDVELTEEQRVLLAREIGVYAECKKDAAEAERDAEVAKSIVEGLRAEWGHESINIPGIAIVTRVSGGETSTLNLKKLCKDFNITPKTLAKYYDKKPKKDYTLITLPKPEGADGESAKPKAKRERDERDDYEDRD
jgi:hypothetical protein